MRVMAVWRIVLVAALLGAAALYPLQYTLSTLSGDFGFETQPYLANAPSITRRVGGVLPRSPAAVAGIHAGDELPLRSVDTASRTRLVFLLPGETGTYDVRSPSRTFRVSLTAGHALPRPFDIVAAIRAVVVFGLWVFALLVIARAWQSEYGPLIAIFLACGVIDAAADAIPWTRYTANVLGAWFLGPDNLIDDICGIVVQTVPVILAARIAGLRIPLVRFALWTAVAISVAAGLVGSVPIFLARHGNASDIAQSLFSTVNPVPFLASAVGMLVAYCYATDENRQRLRWLFWGCFPYLMGIGLINLPSVAASEIGHEQTLVVLRSLFRASELALPVAMIYGVLYRRVIDIGFVLNRVAVYGAVSVALVAIFVLLEYAVSHLLETGRTESLLIQLGIALAIGFSVRYLHRAAEHVVDRVFFAKRHADEAALRRFGHEAEVFSSADTLLDRTIQVIGQHSEVCGAAVYLNRDGFAIATRASGTFPESVEIDDPLLVALRRWNEPVDTHDVRTAFPDGMVFPMSVRGRCIGALACLAKRDGSAFDPDERETLLAIAHGVASGIEAAGSQDSLLAIIESGFARLDRKIDHLISPLSSPERGPL